MAEGIIEGWLMGSTATVDASQGMHGTSAGGGTGVVVWAIGDTLHNCVMKGGNLGVVGVKSHLIFDNKRGGGVLEQLPVANPNLQHHQTMSFTRSLDPVAGPSRRRAPLDQPGAPPLLPSGGAPAISGPVKINYFLAINS